MKEMIEVIFSDGSFGEVRDSRLRRWLSRGIIAAYNPFVSWVEIRRKRNNQ